MGVKWRKQGHVYAPSGDLWWARSHAVLPTAEVVDDSIRVYFASLDENRYGRIGCVGLDAKDPQRILYETREPVLDIGQPGTFDDCGVNPSCTVRVGQHRYLYYSGWQRCERVPYMLFTGLAIGDDGGNVFTKHSRTPVLDRTASESFSRAAPFVLPESGAFRMWYWSCEFWSHQDGGDHYNGAIRHAESPDGIHWNGGDRPCIAPDRPGDYSVGRPWVMRDGAVYRMWYSIRSKARIGYRIGYAESVDGVTWTRKDREAGIDTSERGWDSEMICYPCVVDAHGRRYLFYNGNRRGSTGFGYAVLES
jgi:predicted GH43/DUF377 family glycosyl hydrolase